MGEEQMEGFTLVNTKVMRETEKALLVEHADDEFWIPKSQICDDSEVYGDGHEGDLVITRWLAGQKGWL